MTKDELIKLNDDEILENVYDDIRKYCLFNDYKYKNEYKLKEIILEEINISKIFYDEKQEYNEYLKEKISRHLKKEVNISEDIFREYIRDIDNIETISKEEEESLLKEIKVSKEAKDKIVKNYLKLVIHIAKKYMNHGLSLSDLVQEGNIGLMKAADKYDPSLGFRFSTYAFWWIRQSIARSLNEYGRTIRIPEYVNNKLFTIKKSIALFEKKNYRMPTNEELSIITGLSLSDIDFYKSVQQLPISLNLFIGDEQSDELESIIPNNEEAIDDKVINLEMKEKIESLLNSDILKEKEKEIIKLRFGFYDDRTKTLEQIANGYGLSRERIRQMEAKALNKLRKELLYDEYMTYCDTDEKSKKVDKNNLYIKYLIEKRQRKNY